MAYRHDYDKTLKRLITILSKLYEGEALSVKELANEFGVSERTVQRDFNDRLSGFPIYQDKRKWKMLEGYKLDKNRTFEEQLVLDILDKVTQNIGGRFATTAHGLLFKLKNEELNPIYTKLNIEDISDKLEDIKLLEHAINNHLEITCFYDSSRSGLHEEKLKPLKIANYEGFWYLLAWDEDNYVQTCYLKNVTNIKVTDVPFENDANIDELLKNSISVWFQSDREPYDVKIYASPKAATYFKRRPLTTQKMDSVHQDGSIEFTVTITYEMEIIPIIKYWIPHLKVLEPEWVQEQIDEEITRYLKFK